MKKKNIISLAVALAFLTLGTTGILLFVKQKAHAVEMTHTIFGLVFIGFAIFHIINNWSSLVGYSKERKTGGLKKEFIVALLVFGVVLIAAATEMLEPIAEAGRIFAPKGPPRNERITFEQISTNKEVKGTGVNVLLQKGEETELPVVAVWVEDSAHNFVENLFVPAKIAQIPTDEEEVREGHFDISDFKTETLPTWNAKAKTKTATIEGETPHESFIVKSNTSAKGQFFVVLELQSKGKTEVFEAAIDGSKGEVFKLKSKDGSSSINGIVELK